MTTLADITLQVASDILSVLESTAESGNQSSLTDTIGLRQEDAYFNHGTIWFRSGANSGKVRVIDTHKFNAVYWTGNLSVGPSAGDRYAAARGVIPWVQLRKAINNALDTERSFVLTEDISLVADGGKIYTLPAGVSNVEEVNLVAADGSRSPDFHHRERVGKLYFDFPPSGTLALAYRIHHAELVLDTDTINAEIRTEWLKWQAIENALRWGYRFLQNDPVLKIDVFLNDAIERLKTLSPRHSTAVTVRTGG